MAFADVMKTHASYVAAAHDSEEVVYRHVADHEDETLDARVTRRVVDEMGQILQKTIDVFLARDDMTSDPVIDEDTITITGDNAGTYRVGIATAIEKGYVVLRCIR